MVILCWGSCLGHGTIIEGVFHPARQLAKFSPLNMISILNLFRISLCGEAVNYRPYTSPSFEVASHIKNCHFSHYYYYIIIIIIGFNNSVKKLTPSVQKAKAQIFICYLQAIKCTNLVMNVMTEISTC